MRRLRYETLHDCGDISIIYRTSVNFRLGYRAYDDHNIYLLFTEVPFNFTSLELQRSGW
jgi:hypothetical protein